MAVENMKCDLIERIAKKKILFVWFNFLNKNNIFVHEKINKTCE
jgi:hypothetical protein